MKFNKVFTKKMYNDHLAWLKDNTKGKQLDLTDAWLKGMDLEDAMLMEAILERVNLTDAYLVGVDFDSANLRDADLTDADLSRATLNYADLTYANFTRAKLIVAGLRGAKVNGMNKKGADLTGADFTGADWEVHTERSDQIRKERNEVAEKRRVVADRHPSVVFLLSILSYMVIVLILTSLVDYMFFPGMVMEIWYVIYALVGLILVILGLTTKVEDKVFYHKAK